MAKTSSAISSAWTVEDNLHCPLCPVCCCHRAWKYTTCGARIAAYMMMTWASSASVCPYGTHEPCSDVPAFLAPGVDQTRESSSTIALATTSSKSGPRIDFGRWRSKPSKRESPSSNTSPVTSVGTFSRMLAATMAPGMAHGIRKFWAYTTPSQVLRSSSSFLDDCRISRAGIQKWAVYLSPAS